MNSGLKGYLDPVILAILSDGALHGYAVIEELKVRSGGELDLPEGRLRLRPKGGDGASAQIGAVARATAPSARPPTNAAGHHQQQPPPPRWPPCQPPWPPCQPPAAHAGLGAIIAKSMKKIANNATAAFIPAS